MTEDGQPETIEEWAERVSEQPDLATIKAAMSFAYACGLARNATRCDALYRIVAGQADNMRQAQDHARILRDCANQEKP